MQARKELGLTLFVDAVSCLGVLLKVSSEACFHRALVSEAVAAITALKLAGSSLARLSLGNEERSDESTKYGDKVMGNATAGRKDCDCMCWLYVESCDSPSSCRNSDGAWHG